MLKISWQCVCSITRPGDTLVVVGSHDLIGSWNPRCAITLTTTPQSFPVWRSTEVMLFDESLVLEYKYILRFANGSIQWEPIVGNRVVKLKDGMSCIVENVWGTKESEELTFEVIRGVPNKVLGGGDGCSSLSPLGLPPPGGILGLDAATSNGWGGKCVDENGSPRLGGGGLMHQNKLLEGGDLKCVKAQKKGILYPNTHHWNTEKGGRGGGGLISMGDIGLKNGYSRMNAAQSLWESAKEDGGKNILCGASTLAEDMLEEEEGGGGRDNTSPSALPSSQRLGKPGIVVGEFRDTNGGGSGVFKVMYTNPRATMSGCIMPPPPWNGGENNNGPSPGEESERLAERLDTINWGDDEGLMQFGIDLSCNSSDGRFAQQQQFYPGGSSRVIPPNHLSNNSGSILLDQQNGFGKPKDSSFSVFNRVLSRSSYLLGGGPGGSINAHLTNLQQHGGGDNNHLYAQLGGPRACGVPLHSSSGNSFCHPSSGAGGGVGCGLPIHGGCNSSGGGKLCSYCVEDGVSPSHSSPCGAAKSTASRVILGSASRLGGFDSHTLHSACVSRPTEGGWSYTLSPNHAIHNSAVFLGGNGGHMIDSIYAGKKASNSDGIERIKSLSTAFNASGSNQPQQKLLLQGPSLQNPSFPQSHWVAIRGNSTPSETFSLAGVNILGGGGAGGAGGAGVTKLVVNSSSSASNRLAGVAPTFPQYGSGALYKNFKTSPEGSSVNLHGGSLLYHQNTHFSHNSKPPVSGLGSVASVSNIPPHAEYGGQASGVLPEGNTPSLIIQTPDEMAGFTSCSSNVNLPLPLPYHSAATACSVSAAALVCSGLIGGVPPHMSSYASSSNLLGGAPSPLQGGGSPSHTLGGVGTPPLFDWFHQHQKQGGVPSYFEVMNTIGKGAWGVVKVARDLRCSELRAVKRIAKSPELADRYRITREISILSMMHHPHIVHLYETFEDSANVYLVMEYCAGGELFDRLVGGNFLSEKMACGIMRQILSAVSYCHSKNIAHRDLKPENFLFRDRYENSPLKLIDFGFAAQRFPNSPLRTRTGTAYYVSPEVIQGNHGLECDLWSLGVTMYILLCGYPPFNAYTDHEILHKVQAGKFEFQGGEWQKISSEAKDLISLLLKMDPKNRITAEQALKHKWFNLTNYTTSGLGAMIHPSATLSDYFPSQYYGGAVSPSNHQAGGWVSTSSVVAPGPSPGAGGAGSSTTYAHKNVDALAVYNASADESNEACIVNLSKHRRFRKLSRLKQLGLTLIGQVLDDNNIKKLRNSFIAVDTREDFMLEMSQIRYAIENSGVEKRYDFFLEEILQAVDFKGRGGRINYTEFLALCLQRSEYAYEEAYLAAFNFLDIKGKGKFSAEEARETFKLLGNYDVDVEAEISEADLDGDGEINFQEFCGLMKNIPSLSLIHDSSSGGTPL